MYGCSTIQSPLQKFLNTCPNALSSLPCDCCDGVHGAMFWGRERLRKDRRAGDLSSLTGDNSSLREEMTMRWDSVLFEQYLLLKRNTLSNHGCPVLRGISFSLTNGPIRCYINNWALYTQKPLWLVRSESVKHLSGQVQYRDPKEPGRKENKRQPKQSSGLSRIPCLEADNDEWIISGLS